MREVHRQVEGGRSFQHADIGDFVLASRLTAVVHLGGPPRLTKREKTQAGCSSQRASHAFGVRPVRAALRRRAAYSGTAAGWPSRLCGLEQPCNDPNSNSFLPYQSPGCPTNRDLFLSPYIATPRSCRAGRSWCLPSSARECSPLSCPVEFCIPNLRSTGFSAKRRGYRGAAATASAEPYTGHSPGDDDGRAVSAQTVKGGSCSHLQ